MDLNDLYRDLSQAAFDFAGRRLWTRFGNSDYFAVRVPGETSPMFGVVMGQGGEEFGVTFFRGDGALRCLSAIQGPLGPGDDIMEDMDILGFSMTPFADLPPDAKALARKAGRKPGPREPVPQFIAKHPGRQPRLPDEAELRTLLLALRGLVQADHNGLMKPSGPTGEDGLLTFRLTGDADAPALSVAPERFEPQEGPGAIPFPSARPDLSDLPRLAATWLVGLPPMPAGIEGDRRSLQWLLVADDATGLVLQAKSVFAGELREAVDALLETFRGGGHAGRKGLPREVLFSSRKLHDAVAPILETAGVKCAYLPTIPKLQEIVAGFFEHLGEGFPPSPERLEAPGDLPVPAPDDLAGWKEADGRLAERFADHLRSEDRLWSSRAAKRYFRDDDLEYCFDVHEAGGAAHAYTAWGILDYRPTKRSKTQAEKMLAKGLPEPEEILLRARMETPPTLYRVAAHDPKTGTVTLEDIFLDGTVTVHDRIFSENIDDGIFISGRAFPVGRFHFLELAGPPLGAMMGTEAVEFLQDRGMGFTPDGLRRDAHMFGWLWNWLEEREASWQAPHLCNADGDDLLWHTASFGVADRQEVRRALLERKDIQHDEAEDELVWFRDEEDGRNVLPGPVTLGRIELICDELVLSVNSAGRFDTAREWLEKLPGVTFRSLTTRRLDEPDEDRPMDEKISEPEPVEMTPELTDAVQEMMDKHYMSWLDMPLPALGGRSPRELCRTAAGRTEVTMLIRTMPDPMGRPSVRIPRQAMLRELGLKADPPGDQPADVSVPQFPAKGRTASSSGKISRNAPCPCGSGKKYKKCCGRYE